MSKCKTCNKRRLASKRASTLTKPSESTFSEIETPPPGSVEDSAFLEWTSEDVRTGLDEAEREAGKPQPSPTVIHTRRVGLWWATSSSQFPGAYGQGRTQGDALRSFFSALRDIYKI